MGIIQKIKQVFTPKKTEFKEVADVSRVITGTDGGAITSNPASRTYTDTIKTPQGTTTTITRGGGGGSTTTFVPATPETPSNVTPVSNEVVISTQQNIEAERQRQQEIQRQQAQKQQLDKVNEIIKNESKRNVLYRGTISQEPERIEAKVYPFPTIYREKIGSVIDKTTRQEVPVYSKPKYIDPTKFGEASVRDATPEEAQALQDYERSQRVLEKVETPSKFQRKVGETKGVINIKRNELNTSGSEILKNVGLNEQNINQLSKTLSYANPISFVSPTYQRVLEKVTNKTITYVKDNPADLLVTAGIGGAIGLGLKGSAILVPRVLSKTGLITLSNIAEKSIPIASRGIGYIYVSSEGISAGSTLFSNTLTEDQKINTLTEQAITNTALISGTILGGRLIGSRGSFNPIEESKLTEPVNIKKNIPRDPFLDQIAKENLKDISLSIEQARKSRDLYNQAKEVVLKDLIEKVRIKEAQAPSLMVTKLNNLDVIKLSPDRLTSGQIKDFRLELENILKRTQSYNQPLKVMNVRDTPQIQSQAEIIENLRNIQKSNSVSNLLNTKQPLQVKVFGKDPNISLNEFRRSFKEIYTKEKIKDFENKLQESFDRYIKRNSSKFIEVSFEGKPSVYVGSIGQTQNEKLLAKAIDKSLKVIEPTKLNKPFNEIKEGKNVLIKENKIPSLENDIDSLVKLKVNRILNKVESKALSQAVAFKSIQSPPRRAVTIDINKNRRAQIYLPFSLIKKEDNNAINLSLATLNSLSKEDYAQLSKQSFNDAFIQKQNKAFDNPSLKVDLSKPEKIFKDINLQRPISRTKNRNINTPSLIFPKEPIRKVKFNFDRERKRVKKSNKVASYSVFLKRRGSFNPVAIDVSLNKALRIGSDKTLNTLARTFTIKKTGKQILEDTSEDFGVKQDLFRNYKIKKGKKLSLPALTFIQRSGINTYNEKKALQLARSRSPRRKKGR
jgi:hypothetical protein